MTLLGSAHDRLDSLKQIVVITLALSVLGQAQRLGGVAAIIDAEHALDVNYARKLGVRTDDLLISQPDTGEQALLLVDIQRGQAGRGSDRVARVGEAAREHPKVLDDPAPFIIFEGFGDSSLQLGLRIYLPSLDHRLITKSEINASINSKYEEAGIVIAYPQRDVHLDTRRPLDIRMVQEEG